MYGIKNFAAVINPPHGTILAVGVGEERVYADKGEIKIGQFMTVTLRLRSPRRRRRARRRTAGGVQGADRNARDDAGVTR